MNNKGQLLFKDKYEIILQTLTNNKLKLTSTF